MKITINIDDKLLANAQHCTGERDKTKLVRLALEALIQRHLAKWLIALRGMDPNAKAAPRW
jgi:Arc/MetJ family transcription regulator